MDPKLAAVAEQSPETLDSTSAVLADGEVNEHFAVQIEDDEAALLACRKCGRLWRVHLVGRMVKESDRNAVMAHLSQSHTTTADGKPFGRLR